MLEDFVLVQGATIPSDDSFVDAGGVGFGVSSFGFRLFRHCGGQVFPGVSGSDGLPAYV